MRRRDSITAISRMPRPAIDTIAIATGVGARISNGKNCAAATSDVAATSKRATNTRAIRGIITRLSTHRSATASLADQGLRIA